MNYYEKKLKKIEYLLNNNQDDALKLINEELSISYIPKYFKDKIEVYKKNICNKSRNMYFLRDEEIIEYLNSSEDKQLFAVNCLNSKNLREYHDIVQKFLISNGTIYAKTLLILSLMNQEINLNYYIKCNDKKITFNPSKAIFPILSEGYTESLNILDNYYIKNPDKLNLAKELLYNECFLHLPLSYSKNDANYICNNIINTIENAFK